MLLSLPEYSTTFTDAEIQVPGESGPPDALHSARSTPCGGAVGLPLISPITKPLDKRVGKMLNVLCLPVDRHRAVCLPLSLLYLGSHPHVHTGAETSATMCDRLYSSQRDTELWHPLISCHSSKSRLNEVKSK